MSDTEADVEELLERAAAYTREVEEAIEHDDVETALERLEELLVLADEAEDVVSRVDLTELAATVDWSNLPEAVDPEAVGSGDVTEAVALRELLSLSDLPDLWDSVDVREAWREYREFDDALDDVGEESTDEGIASGGDPSTGRDGADVDATGGLAEVDPETVENAVQSGISDAVGEFRESLLAAHERLASLREANRERIDSFRSESRNPTAGVSTIPPKGAIGDTTRHSTVPEETRHSGAPNRRRIYGTRFEEAVGDD